MKASFPEAIEKFMVNVEALKETLPSVMRVLDRDRRAAEEEFRTFIMTSNFPEKKVEGTTTYTIPIDAVETFRRLNRRRRRAQGAHVMVPRSFLVSLVSTFDAYLGHLLRAMFAAQPGLLNACDRQIEFSQLVSFSSIDEAREYVVEKEVEAVIRENHAEHFRWLEAKLKIPLREGLDVWPTFIELTERRNLFVHCDGVVSSQYLKVCHEHKVPGLESVKIGTTKFVSPKYFASAASAVLEIGVKLGHVMWRKLLPAERQQGDNLLNFAAYQLLAAEEYELAIRLLEFATKVLKAHSSEEMRLTFVVNLAQAYKWKGRTEDCSNLIKGIDWSATGPKFRLARHVLLEENDKAAELMRLIGAKGEVSATHYRDWPVFKNWRKTDSFLAAYRETFGSDFVAAETEVRSEDSLHFVSDTEGGSEESSAVA